MPYDTSARGYLARARQRLDEPGRESLFYAAFELRAGIEARLHEYLEAHRDAAAKERHGWVIPKLARELERAFHMEKVARVTIVHPTGAVPPQELLYTPVPKALQRMGEKMGDLLHSAKSHEDDDPWWAQQRRFLEDAYKGLQLAASGMLLGPLLMSREGKAEMRVEIPHEELPRFQEVLQHLPGARMELRVEYLDTLPDETAPPDS